MRDNLILLEETDSTNALLKQLALQGAEEYTAVLAARQTGGRGRLGRSFFSPEGGVYLSVLYRPKTAVEEISSFTVLAAVAVCRGIEKYCGLSCGIKWTNDVEYEGRKLCGILCESVFRGSEANVIVGVGLNVKTKDFPEDIRDRAGSLAQFTEKPLDPQEVAFSVLEELDAAYRAFPGCRKAAMEEYRGRCTTLGREVSWQKDGETCRGLAVGVDDLGGLVIETAAGTEILRWGEASVLPEREKKA